MWNPESVSHMNDTVDFMRVESVYEGAQDCRCGEQD